MSTWADHRESSPKEDQEKSIANVKRFNGLLKKFKDDSYLQDVLKNPTVQAAIMHWTGVARLSPEIARQFERNQHVMHVFQKMQMISHEANKNPIANTVLVQCMTGGIPELTPEQVFQLYGQEVTMAVCGAALKQAAAAKAREGKTEAASKASAKNKKTDKTVAASLKTASEETPKDMEAKALLQQFTMSTADAAEDTVKNPYPTSAPAAAGVQTDSAAAAVAVAASAKGESTGVAAIMEQLAWLSMWGHEDPTGPDWTLVKWLARIMIDVLIYGALGYWFALQFQQFVPDPFADADAVDAPGVGAGVVEPAPARPEMNENYEF
jgi:hypothetical protein